MRFFELRVIEWLLGGDNVGNVQQGRLGIFLHTVYHRLTVDRLFAVHYPHFANWKSKNTRERVIFTRTTPFQN
jgi:hypothetical protein